MKSFVPKESSEGADGGDSAPPKGSGGRANFRGERRSNAAHASTTDPGASLYRKGRGQEAKLADMSHILIENSHGLVVDATVTRATGTAEREAALAMVDRTPRGKRRITLGADKGYDV